jgi:hypothetical protein
MLPPMPFPGSACNGVIFGPGYNKLRPNERRAAMSVTSQQGLTLAQFKTQLEDLRDTSLTSELNLSTFGPHQRVNMGCVGDEVSLS